MADGGATKGEDNMTDESIEQAGSDRRKFLAGAAGAAGLAAGAALGGSTPAGAIGTTGEHDLDIKTIDLDASPTPTLSAVSLGTGGFAKGIFSAFGDMAAVTIRIKIGSGATTGDGPWCMRGVDMPTDFVPKAPPSDMTTVGTTAWTGTGTILDLSNANQSQYFLGCGWNDWSAVSLGTLFVWAFSDRHNDGSGNVMLNYDGSVPFGTPLQEGTLIYSTLVYLVDTTT